MNSNAFTDKIIKIRCNPRDIVLVHKIFEALEGLALVTTVDSREGFVDLYTSAGCWPEVREIIEHFPIALTITGTE